MGEKIARSQLLLKRLRGVATDVILNANGVKFPAHRAILISGSDYFGRLFSGSFREASQGEIKIQIDPRVFGRVLNIIYGDPYLQEDETFELELALHYFDVKDLDFKEMVPLPFSTAHFSNYANFVSQVYPEEIPDKIMDHIASRIAGSSYVLNRVVTQPPDLSNLSDDFIMALFLNPHYSVPNLIEFYNMVKGLVEKGHSTDLLTVINYDLFPTQIRSYFTEEFKSRVQKSGPIPRLSEQISIVDSVPEDTDIEPVALMGQDKLIAYFDLTIWFSGGPVKVGDIGLAAARKFHSSMESRAPRRYPGGINTANWVQDTPNSAASRARVASLSIFS